LLFGSGLTNNSILSGFSGLMRAKSNPLALDSGAQIHTEKGGFLATKRQRQELETYMNRKEALFDSFQWYLDDLLMRFKARARIRISEVDSDSAFYALRIHLWLAQLTMQGASITGKSSDSVANIFKKKLNNWYDNTVIRSAAYTGYQISEDKDTVEKCHYLSERGICHLRASSLHQFLLTV
jgi:hypothetical protein